MIFSVNYILHDFGFATYDSIWFVINRYSILKKGGSHDRTDILPLKAGIGIMALGAMDKNPNCKVKIIPCGLNYYMVIIIK